MGKKKENLRKAHKVDIETGLTKNVRLFIMNYAFLPNISPPLY